MASSTTVQNSRDKQNDLLKMLDKLIETVIDDNERVQYYSRRAKILFDMNKWNGKLRLRLLLLITMSF
ncbi:unnamed protein product [Rotaria sp. Silwood1]|nr:unnamed protein product [Rotaria sp. Silwood1]CAF1566430.1 unnamed protein product [Rotaria sp. Silwood1]CAF1567291.1 unnamed protein product [Rotaria sp. Silwood1]CAF3685768.1 unnamed protein product [Rotaria sp. Silwood1]